MLFVNYDLTGRKIPDILPLLDLQPPLQLFVIEPPEGLLLVVLALSLWLPPTKVYTPGDGTVYIKLT